MPHMMGLGRRRSTGRGTTGWTAVSFAAAIHGCAEPPARRAPLPPPVAAQIDVDDGASEQPSATRPIASEVVASSAVTLAPSASAVPPRPALSATQAAECAAKAARTVAAQPTLTPAPSSHSALHWFTFDVPDGQPLAVAVEDATCIGGIAPEVGSDVRFDGATAKRFLALRKRAIGVVQSDAEVKSICKRLERLKAEHPNLQGCVKWLEHFPSDLCNHPPPALIGPPEEHLAQILQRECHWHFYLGESMTTHTSRHFTLIVDAHRGRLIGARSAAGSAFGAKTWRAAPTTRSQLRRSLRRDAVVRGICGNDSECPTIGNLSHGCSSENCFVVTLHPEITVDMEVLHGRPIRVFDGGDPGGMTYATWLKSLGTTQKGASPASP